MKDQSELRTKNKKSGVTVVNDPVFPIATEVLAASITAISRGAAKLLETGLNRRALLVLLKDSSGVSISDIDKVLDALPKLERTYTK